MPDPDFSNALAAERPAGDVNLTERPEDTAHRFAVKLGKLDALHLPWRIYDEPDHYHDPDDAEMAAGDHARVETRDFATCEAMYLYTICTCCCTDAGGNQTEQCVTTHDHGKDKPRCPTAAILDGSDDE